MKCILLGVLLATLISRTIQDDEHPRIESSSEVFTESSTRSIETLRKARFGEELQTPSFGSVSDDAINHLKSEIAAETPITGVGTGSRGATYDVILQPGHYGRTTGAVGTHGSIVSERALAAYITGRIAQQLRAQNVNVLVVSADEYLKPSRGAVSFDGLKGKVFLAIHADGNPQPCKTGPSLGYAANSNPLAMHAVGWALGAALGYRYMDFKQARRPLSPDEFRPDNFTANEAQYYMFRQVRADRLTGLLEIGELTCPESEKRLIASSQIIAADVARALIFLSSTQMEGER